MAIAYTKYDGYFAESSGNLMDVTEHLAQAAGIQDELEERLTAWAVPGVISGGACSIDGTSIAVATIDAYAQGKRFKGADSISFVGEGADTYYVYLDPTDEVTPLTIGTSVPSGEELCLCQVDWNGTDTLSALVDLRAWGIYPMQFTYNVIGAVTADVIGIEILPRDFWIEGVQASLETCGTGAGPTYIDVHAGTAGSESTIWTTQTRRVTIAHDASDGAVVAGGVPQANRKLSAGNKMLIEVDAVATDPVDLCVTVQGRTL